MDWLKAISLCAYVQELLFLQRDTEGAFYGGRQGHHIWKELDHQERRNAVLTGPIDQTYVDTNDLS